MQDLQNGRVSVKNIFHVENIRNSEWKNFMGYIALEKEKSASLADIDTLPSLSLGSQVPASDVSPSPVSEAVVVEVNVIRGARSTFHNQLR